MARHRQMDFVIKVNRWLATILFLAAGPMTDASLASDTRSSNHKRIVGVEYLAPIEKSRDISTVIVDFEMPLSTLENLRLSTYFSLTGTYSTGSIIQLEGNLEGGTLKEVHYDDSAFGLGPGLSASIRLFDTGRLSSHIDGNGNIIIHNTRFPSGGDYYNFMWRGGPTLGFNIDESRAIVLGFQWAHTSNGQGVGPKNPSFDSRGVVLLLKGFF